MRNNFEKALIACDPKRPYIWFKSRAAPPCNERKVKHLQATHQSNRDLAHYSCHCYSSIIIILWSFCKSCFQRVSFLICSAGLHEVMRAFDCIRLTFKELFGYKDSKALCDYSLALSDLRTHRSLVVSSAGRHQTRASIIFSGGVRYCRERLTFKTYDPSLFPETHPESNSQT